MNLKISVLFYIFMMSSVSFAAHKEGSDKKLTISCENCRKLHIKCNSKTPCDNCITKKIPCIRKEKIVGQACGNCRRNHQACDKFRPCKNCRDSGLECVQNKRRQKKKNASAKARVSPRQPGKKTNQEADRIYIWTNYDFQDSFPSYESSEESSCESKEEHDLPTHVQQSCEKAKSDDQEFGEMTHGHGSQDESNFPYLSEIFSHQ